MPRNGSGQYSLPQPAFVPGTTISSSAVNSDLSDIASALTASIAADGQTPISGPFKFPTGTAAAPTVTFNSDITTGMYLHGTGELGFATAGALAAWLDSAKKLWVLGDLNVAGTSTITVPAGSITYAEIQNVAAGKILGNPTASPAAVSEITPSTGLSLSVGGLLTAPAFPPTSAFKNLAIKVVTNTTVSVNADFVVVSDGTNFVTKPVSATINLGTNGVVNSLDQGTIAIDSWYFIHVIYNGTTVGALASLSATAPVLPSGYTFAGRVGAVKTIHGSAILYGTWQFGREARFVLGLAGTTISPLATSGVHGDPVTGPTWFSVTVNGGNAQQSFVPSTASAVYITLGTGSTGGVVAAAPNANYGVYNSISIPPPISLNGSAQSQDMSDKILLEAASIQYASGSASGVLMVRGWEDNI